MTRVLREYDALWLTLTAWAIFVYALAVKVSMFFDPLVPIVIPLFGAAAVVRAARWRIAGRRDLWYIGTTYLSWALAHYCCP